MRCAPAVGLGALLLACAPAAPRSSASRPAPAAAPAAPSASASPLAPASASAVAAPPLATVPELVFEPFRAEGKALNRVFAIEGATIVTTNNVVGYVEGDRVEWIAKVPKERAGIGENIIVHVDGKYLDRIDVVMETNNGRALSPVWLPLTGKGTVADEAPGGGFGTIVEARLGDSVVLATYSGFNGYRMVTVRGPSVTRRFTNARGCKGSYFSQPNLKLDEVAAVPAAALQATTTGELVSIGTRCMEEGPFAEIWPAGSTTSRLVDLGRHWRSTGYYAALLRGAPGELWAYSNDMDPILRFRDGELTPLPLLEAPIAGAWVSTTGQLHVRAGDGIHRLRPDGRGWELAARLRGAPDRIRDMVMDASGGFWASTDGEVHRLREASSVPAEAACPSWFAHLYDASAHEKPRSPAVWKMLADYPKGEGLRLVQTQDWRSNDHVGVLFATKAEAEALVAHTRSALPDLRPAVFCHAPRRSSEIRRR